MAEDNTQGEKIGIIKNILHPDEIAAIKVSLEGLIEDMEMGLKEPRMNDYAKTQMKDILKNAKSAYVKIAQSTGREAEIGKLPDVNDDDIAEFTKQE